MKNLKSSIHLVLLFCLTSFLLGSCTKVKDKNIIIENGKLKLGFDKHNGTLLIFEDLVNSHEYLNENIVPNLPWEIDFYQSFDTSKIKTVAPTEFSYSMPNQLTLILKWGKFEGIDNQNFQVTATIALNEKKALSNWKISIDGIDKEQINKVVFPKIAGIKDIGDENLAVPAWMGMKIKHPRNSLSEIVDKEKKYEWTYPGILSLQCLALYDSKVSGLYASCNDTKAYRKNFSFTLDTLNTLTYKMNNYPALDSKQNSYEIPYEAVLGTFKGDWITAAEQYREWGAKQKWSKESRLKNKLVTPWLEKTALWVWNRNKSDNVLVPATELKEKLALPVNVFWHWWHGCSYDDGFPEYIPPREGKESFIKAMSDANDKGVRAIVYMNSFQWGDDTESWKNENASLHAVKDINGNLRSHVYNIFSGKSLTNMCMATQFWKEKYASLCDSVVNNYHVNGVYMDQACLNRMCYDTTHGHSIGGGKYWVENFGKLTSMIRPKIADIGPTALAGEGCGEPWMPLLDVMLTLQVSRERYAGVGPIETIPFFQAVYHEYAITYGSYSSLIVPPYDDLWPREFAPKDPLKPLSKDFSKQYFMEQARSFVWGLQPTLANYQSFLDSERKGEIDYLMDLAKIRYKGLKYLLYGKFMRSPEIEIPKEEIDISRLSIYAGKTGGSVTKFQKSVPLIYSGTWKAEDGSIGIALASISENPIPITFSLDAADYGLSNTGEIFILDKEGRNLLTTYSGGQIKVDFQFKAKGLCILEIISKK